MTLIYVMCVSILLTYNPYIHTIKFRKIDVFILFHYLTHINSVVQIFLYSHKNNAPDTMCDFLLWAMNISALVFLCILIIYLVTLSCEHHVTSPLTSYWKKSLWSSDNTHR